VYANTAFADEYLLARGLATHRSVPIDKINYHHERFNACIGLSIELGCKRDPNLEFISEHTLLPRAPWGSREVPCDISHTYQVWDKGYGGWRPELRHGNASLIPDAYFAMKQQFDDGPQYLACFRETDCGTEPLSRADLNDKSWLATHLKYRHIFKLGKYKQHFGLTCDALVLVVTTSKTRTENIQEKLLDITDQKGSPYILFQTWPEFIEEFYVPKEPHYGLVTEPWQRVGVDKNGQPYKPLYLAMPN
jgi:hypothetical protein